MATIDGYVNMITRARKDPLGPSVLNDFFANGDLLAKFLGQEHLLTSANGDIGEHNAAEIPRCGALAEYTGPGAPAYTLRGASDYISYGSNPGSGELRLTVTSGKLTTGRLVVQVQNCSESGLTKPCWTLAKELSATSIQYISQTLSSAMGSGNGIATTTENPHILTMISSDPLSNPMFSNVTPSLSGLPRRGMGLRGQSLWNVMVQRSGDLYGAFNAFHSTATGAHDDRRIAKACGHLTYAPTTYTAVANHSVGLSTITRLGAGQVRVALSPTFSGTAYPFVMVDYARGNGGAATDIYCAVTPYSKMSSAQFEVYLYKYDAASPGWNAADTDFWVTVHDGGAAS